MACKMNRLKGFTETSCESMHAVTMDGKLFQLSCPKERETDCTAELEIQIDRCLHRITVHEMFGYSSPQIPLVDCFGILVL